MCSSSGGGLHPPCRYKTRERQGGCNPPPHSIFSLGILPERGRRHGVEETGLYGTFQLLIRRGGIALMLRQVVSRQVLVLRTQRRLIQLDGAPHQQMPGGIV
jgi:hypothetical protein